MTPCPASPPPSACPAAGRPCTPPTGTPSAPTPASHPRRCRPHRPRTAAGPVRRRAGRHPVRHRGQPWRARRLAGPVRRQPAVIGADPNMIRAGIVLTAPRQAASAGAAGRCTVSPAGRVSPGPPSSREHHRAGSASSGHPAGAGHQDRLPAISQRAHRARSPH